MLLATENEIDIATVRSALPQLPAAQVTNTHTSGALAERVECFERETILSELRRNDYHVSNTAKTLGLERSHLYKKAEHLGIDLQALRRGSGSE
jgi:DNA-binding NtrC family response regulator